MLKLYENELKQAHDSALKIGTVNLAVFCCCSPNGPIAMCRSPKLMGGSPKKKESVPRKFLQRHHWGWGMGGWFLFECNKLRKTTKNFSWLKSCWKAENWRLQAPCSPGCMQYNRLPTHPYAVVFHAPLLNVLDCQTSVWLPQRFGRISLQKVCSATRSFYIFRCNFFLPFTAVLFVGVMDFNVGFFVFWFFDFLIFCFLFLFFNLFISNWR